VGEFDKKDGIVQASSRLVAIFNAKMLHSFHNQLYSPKINFFTYGKGGEIIDGHRILKELSA